MKSSNSKKRPIETLQQDDDEDDDVAVLETSTPQHDEGKVGACRSLVWKDMERLESTDKSETKARCLHCKAILTAKSKSGTSHLKRHLDKFLAKNNLTCSLLSCAIVLDPRYKLWFVEYCYTVLYGEVKAKEKVEEVRGLLCDLLKEYRDVDGEGVGNSVDHFEITSPSGIPIITPTSSDRMDAYSIWISRKEKFSVDKSQLDLYLEEKNFDHKSKLDVLAWWKNNGAPRHPQLTTLARDILAIPISSVPSESAFSMGKKLINPWRASLASMTIEILACYEDWLRAKGFSFGWSLFDVQEDEDEDENEDEVNKDNCEVID
ncbi:Zinc finger BED domain-containing protein RICESLEEPER 2 [Bienertia sinuspersici]